jgi:hypothetical protein
MPSPILGIPPSIYAYQRHSIFQGDIFFCLFATNMVIIALYISFLSHAILLKSSISSFEQCVKLWHSYLVVPPGNQLTLAVSFTTHSHKQKADGGNIGLAGLIINGSLK